jgi:hypothetical protein
VGAARGLLIALQEEIDWDSYRRYGLIEEDLTFGRGELPEVDRGSRPFEIALARRIQVGEESSSWFEKHDSVPRVEIPDHLPPDYRELLARRLSLLGSHPFIAMLERPEYKRRWAADDWAKVEANALRDWIMIRLEKSSLWFDNQGRPVPKSLAVLADEIARDSELVDVLALWEGRRDVTVAATLEKLVGPQSVPFLAAHRYKESGMRKRAAWEATWDLQRQEDAGSYRPVSRERGGDGPIPVPPKYAAADFSRPEYWTNRGKVDMPREAFILYPGAGRVGDPTPVIGWAGWDHAQQALALATLIQSAEQQDWSEQRLTPLVAGLSELLPWLEQWHCDPDPLYGGGSPAEFFSGLLDSYMAKLGATPESLAAWRPPAVTRGRKTKS